MNPFEGLAKFALGWIHEGHVQGWMRLAASLAATCFVSFFGGFGITAIGALQGGKPPAFAFALGIAVGSLWMSLSALGIWKMSPLSKGIPILIPGAIQAEKVKQLTQSGDTFDPNAKR